MINNSYLTTSIPYVNAAPHLGHALEFVQADVLARHRRQQGGVVRLLSGTDDNAMKNVTAAQAAGVPTAAFVDANASRFAELITLLEVSLDDFIRTGSDPRHRAGVQRLWRECAARGDFYQREYTGLYCLGCEQFYDQRDLAAGWCLEHRRPLEQTTEVNWFFRLSRYSEPIEAAIRTSQLRIEPAERRNEVLALINSGLVDISVSRPAKRADGWGIPVPDDHEQVIYVWWDALANYVTALDYGGDQFAYQNWWRDAQERIHVIGKGITRFHAVYWLGLLLSAQQPLPTTIFVHEYVTEGGAKISKSAGTTVNPRVLIQAYGVDAVHGGCCATSPGSVTPTSPSRDWFSATTRTWRAVWAIWSAAAPRWCVASETDRWTRGCSSMSRCYRSRRTCRLGSAKRWTDSICGRRPPRYWPRWPRRIATWKLNGRGSWGVLSWRPTHVLLQLLDLIGC